MIQLDLFAAAEPAERRCGTCVVWNALPGAARGDCAITSGSREATDEPARADCWFPLDELRKGMYGRRG